MSPRRAGRIQNELRLWLRERYGVQDSYAKSEIDIGMESLGFRSLDDALIAYTFFGPDLVPGFLASLDTTFSPEDLTGVIDALNHDTADIAGLFGDGDV